MRPTDECLVLETRSRSSFAGLGLLISKFVCCVLVVGLLTVASATSCQVLGQDSNQQTNSNSTSVELDDSSSEDLLAAMKSLDKTMNRQSELDRQKQMRDRLVGFSVFGGAILGLLTVLFVYLRMDHATRGFHSGRLQMMAGLISLAILAICYILWTQVLFK